MAFLTPWYLLGLLGVAIPLAIHLIRRQKAERIVLPTVRFLKKAPKKLVHFQKFQQWLLLALRVAMAGLLALAFARPVLTNAVPQLLSGTPKSLVIALDISMSMGYGHRFQEAQAAALTLLKSLKPEDEAAVVTFADGPGPMQALTTDHAALEAFVKSLPAPGFRATHFLPALRMADQILHSAENTEKILFLVSDYQGSAAPAEADAWTLSQGIGFKAVKVGDDRISNLAVTDVSVAISPAQGQETHRVVGRIENLGSEQLSDARVSLEIDGRSIAEQFFDLPPRSQRIVSFPIAVTQSGEHGGFLKVQGDGFESDNQRFFTFRIAPPVRVLVVTDKSFRKGDAHDPTIWLRSALEDHPQALFQVDVGHPGDIRSGTLASYAVVVLMSAGNGNPEQIRALSAYVKGGGGLLLAPGDGVDVDAFNRAWTSVAPVLLRGKQVMTGGAALSITRIEKHHAIVRSLQTHDTTDFGAARFHGYWESEPARDSEVILGFENGQAALASKTVGNGRVLLFASSLDPSWNNFPRQVMYLPLMHEVVGYLAGRRDQKTTFLVGDIAPIPVPAGGMARITSPQGRETLVRPVQTDTAYFEATDQPGLFEVRSGNWMGRFSVNISPRESDLEPMTPEAIRDMVTVSPMAPRPPDAVQAASLQVNREASQQFWWWLLLGVLMLGVMETFLANRTYR